MTRDGIVWSKNIKYSDLFLKRESSLSSYSRTAKEIQTAEKYIQQMKELISGKKRKKNSKTYYTL